MHCTSCQSDNPDGHKFCGQCGAPLKAVCPSCSFANEPESKFCGGCGTPLGQPDEVPKATTAERRQLTVMFCDLVGSTALSERLDPEDLRDAISAYQDTAAKAIERYDGYIARYMGDGLLIYFGYPNAHERDAERAVRAGLDIIDAMKGMRASDGTALEVRIGAATGMVVAGDIIGSGASEERAVLGDTPNLAARLQGLAAPDTMVVSATTQTLCGPGLRSTSLGEHDLKGISKPVTAVSVQGIGYSRHLSPAGSEALSGRQEPLDRFSKLWKAAQEGHGGVILIRGEAGIGKSSLLTAFRQQVQNDNGGETVLVGSEFHQDSALRPLREYLLSELKTDGTDDGNGDQYAALARFLERLDLDSDAMIPVLAHLLALPPSATYPPINVDGATLKDKTSSALLEIIRAQSEHGAHLLVADDVQWMDASTLEIVEQILAQGKSRPLLCVLATRPEFDTSPFEDHASATVLLERLDPTAAREVITQIAGTSTLQPWQLDNILGHADGVPLFLEEITRSAIEANLDQNDQSNLAIPTTLQDSLMARLDRLGSAKTVAQTAAVIGRVFRRDVLLAVADNKNADLDSALLDLIAAGLIMTAMTGPDGGFEFKQALIRDAAYQSLLIRTRRDLHRCVADELEKANRLGIRSEPEVIAYHLNEAGLADRALPLWIDAAQSAARRWANAEAVNFYGKALIAHRETKPDETPTHIGLLLDMIASMRIIDRFEDAFRALDEAQALCSEDANSDELIRVHYLRGNMYFPVGNIEGCLKEHTEACRLARKTGRADFEARALGGIGDAYMLDGEISRAENHFDQSVQICRDHQMPDIETGNLAMRGHMRLYLLRFEEALEDSHQAISMAVDAGNRRSEMVCQGSILAKILADQGRWSEAEQALRAALEIVQNLGALRYQPMYLSLLARVLWATGRNDDALAAAEKALAGAREDGMVYTGAMVLGAYAKVCGDQNIANDCLTEGLSVLTGRVPAHNHLWFQLDAMDTALGWQDWDRVDQHADSFETFSGPKNIPWAIYHIERCRLLSTAGRGSATEDDRARLRVLMTEAGDRGQNPAMQSIEATIS